MGGTPVTITHNTPTPPSFLLYTRVFLGLLIVQTFVTISVHNAHNDLVSNFLVDLSDRLGMVQAGRQIEDLI